jgi:hypothetical protein
MPQDVQEGNWSVACRVLQVEEIEEIREEARRDDEKTAYTRSAIWLRVYAVNDYG